MLVNLYSVFLLLTTTYADDEDRTLYSPPALAPRESWNARPPSYPLPNNILPADMVVIQHTGTEQCHKKCMKRVANIQSFQMNSNGLADISYNFLIGGDGVVYVGRGWYKQAGDRKGAIEVAFIGDFHKELPNKYQFEAFIDLIEMGLSLNFISSDFVLVGKCQLTTSDSPGHAFMELLSGLPHFDQSLPSQCTEFVS